MIDEIHYLDKHKSDRLLLTVKNIRHKVAILVMMDCGLRVSECVSLKIANFDFKKRNLTVQSLKKRGDVVKRTIPISDRLYDALSLYVPTLKLYDSNQWIFPNPSDSTKPITRKALNQVCVRLQAKDPNLKGLHPHALRHTCATQLLSSGAQLHEVREVLGHKRYDTTLIYAHIPQEILRQRIDSMTRPTLGTWERVKNYLVPPKRRTLINLAPGTSNFIVGRTDELTKVTDLIERNCNVILIGGIGQGKTHLLSQVQPTKKVLRFDDFGEIKKTLISALMYLYKNDKEHIFNLLYGDFDLSKLDTQLQRDSVSGLCKALRQATARHEYVLMIDNCDKITPKGIKALEELKDHFVLVTTARTVPVNRSSFLWNFEIIRLAPLTRHHSLELIHRLGYDLEVEDFELFRNHIWDQSGGNPRVICELIERYRKEVIISTDIIRSVRHYGALPEIDMSFIVVLGLSSLAILRYLSAEVGNDSLRFIGGSAMILLLFSRYIFNFTKRKLV